MAEVLENRESDLAKPFSPLRRRVGYVRHEEIQRPLVIAFLQRGTYLGQLAALAQLVDESRHAGRRQELRESALGFASKSA